MGKKNNYTHIGLNLGLQLTIIIQKKFGKQTSHTLDGPAKNERALKTRVFGANKVS